MGCILLQFSPVPLVGGGCSLINSIKQGDASGIIIDTIFLGLDIFTFGLGGKIKDAAKGVSSLARSVRKGGKIVKGIIIAGK